MQTIQLFVYNKGHTSISILKSLQKQGYIKIAQYIKIYSLFFDSTSRERDVNLVGITKAQWFKYLACKTTYHELNLPGTFVFIFSELNI